MFDDRQDTEGLQFVSDSEGEEGNVTFRSHKTGTEHLREDDYVNYKAVPNKMAVLEDTFVRPIHG